MSRRQRTRELAFILPFVSLFLLLPPVVGLFRVSADVVGIPLVVLYVFGVWVALIVATVFVSRRLSGTED